MSFKRRVVIFAFVSCFNFCISQLQQPPTQSNVQVDDLTALLPIVGTKFATFDIEVQPGDASTEEDLTSELIGDGFGEPLYYLRDSRFLEDELGAAEDNMFLPLSFPHVGYYANEDAQVSPDASPRFMMVRNSPIRPH